MNFRALTHLLSVNPTFGKLYNKPHKTYWDIHYIRNNTHADMLSKENNQQHSGVWKRHFHSHHFEVDCFSYNSMPRWLLCFFTPQQFTNNGNFHSLKNTSGFAPRTFSIDHFSCVCSAYLFTTYSSPSGTVTLGEKTHQWNNYSFYIKTLQKSLYQTTYVLCNETI